MDELMEGSLMTLKMTRKVYPMFKRLLESTRLKDGKDEVEIKVDATEQGEITLWMTRTCWCKEHEYVKEEEN